VLAYLSLGSNLGDRAQLLRDGVAAVAAGDAYRVSPLYSTTPVGGPEQSEYLNVVVELATTASPVELLARCEAAEAAARRVRVVRFGPRTLDCDVLLVGDLVVETPELVVPHPRMWTRRFVLQPLADLAPHLVETAVLDAAEGEVARIGTLATFH
jgi:2-amino-4-hydroxy-6-hydroxymethyldihydropteridine diphosphokinase